MELYHLQPWIKHNDLITPPLIMYIRDCISVRPPCRAEAVLPSTPHLYIRDLQVARVEGPPVLVRLDDHAHVRGGALSLISRDPIRPADPIHSVARYCHT